MLKNRITKYLDASAKTDRAPQAPNGFVRCQVPGQVSPQQMAFQQEIYRKALDDARRQVLERDLFGE